MTEEFNPSDACVAWLSMEIDTLILTLEFLLSEQRIKRHRLGGTMVFCRQKPGMEGRAAVLKEFLGKLDAANVELSAAQ